MKKLTHHLKIIGMLILGFWIIGFMFEAAFKFTLSLLCVGFWGLILLGIYAGGEILLRGLSRQGTDSNKAP